MSTIAARVRVTQRWEITRQALRTGRRTLVIWAASFAALIALYAVIWPSVRGNTSWRNLFDTLPATYRALFTASGTIDLSTAGGYLGVELMGFMGPALIAVYAITTGAAAIAGEEDRGGLEVTLSAPVSRIRVFTERCAGLVIGITILMIATGAALWIFSALLGMGLGVGAIASGAAGLPVAAVASYLINALAQITSVIRPARPVSPYYLVLGNEPLAHGLRLIGAVSVLAAVAVLAVAGGILFARRDLS